ncbi:MAG: DNA photolyase [Desulfobulbaceae bacterium]|nr:DNA photolyase [Desulfobulbaceae bacterium]MCK5544306.1 DNA photolyase [Desulfobulbaceae bacterium]
MNFFTPVSGLTHRDPVDFIRRIFVEKSCVDLPYTREILSRAGAIPVEVLDDRQTPESGLNPYPESLAQGKRDLFLCRNRGKFFKSCPGTREYRCCGYYVLNIGMNCPMDCVYCILQAYLNNPWLSFFVNVDDLLSELTQAVVVQNKGFLRIGTGEFTDSMALDRLTRLSGILVEFMRDKDSAILELKTKATVVDHLKDLDHGGRTILAWSLNSQEVMAREEFRTAPFEARLAAAADCASWGYRLAFHFDPIIYHPGWKEGYAETVERLFDSVPKESIVWISMGALRFLPALKSIAGKRFPNSRFFHEEFVPGLDGKSRYFRSLRVEMYKHLFDLISRRASSDTCVYFCMESDEIWREVFGFCPEERGGLPAMLDRTVE